MNKLFLFIVFTVSIQFAYAQVTDKNKQKSEMQQAIDEMKKEISDLEAEIKIAEKTDPDEATELKNELAKMKKMLSMFDKPVSPAVQLPKNQATNISVPKTIASPIVPVLLKQPVTIPTAAQAKNRLLWYKGKKYNDSTLVTEKGMIVQLSKKNNTVILQPQKKTDPFDKLVQELVKDEQRKTELVDKFDKLKNGFMFYPELKNSLALYDDLTIMLNSVLKNTIQLPVVPMPVSAGENAVPGKNGRGPFIEFESYDTLPKQNRDEQFLNQMTQKWEMELALAKKLFKELPPVSEFPGPPMQEFGNCNFCDTNFLSKQRIQDSIWHDKYLSKEQRIAQIILGVENQRQLLGSEGGDISLLDTLFKRGRAKNKILVERYGKDIRYMKNVSIVILGFERQIQLLGGSDDSLSGIQAVAKNFGLYDKYLDEQIEAKNHDFVLNIASHLGNERMKQILGTAESDAAGFSLPFQKILNYNRFALSIELDFIIEQRNNKDELQFKVTGAMNTKEKANYGMLVSDGCSYRMIQYNTDLSNAQLKNISIPLFVKSGRKTIRNKENKLEDFSYTGPESFQLLFPDFNIEFCNSNNPDSAFFATLMGDEVAANMYMGNLNNNIENYKTDFLGFANLALLNTDVGKNNNTMGNLSAEMMTTISGFQNQNSGGSKIDKLKMQYEGKLQMDGYKKNMQSQMNDKKSILLFYANNKSTVLIDKFEDTKRKLYDDFDLVRGLIHLKVLHDPAK